MSTIQGLPIARKFSPLDMAIFIYPTCLHIERCLSICYTELPGKLVSSTCLLCISSSSCNKKHRQLQQKGLSSPIKLTLSWEIAALPSSLSSSNSSSLHSQPPSSVLCRRPLEPGTLRTWAKERHGNYGTVLDKLNRNLHSISHPFYHINRSFNNDHYYPGKSAHRNPHPLTLNLLSPVL